MKLKSIKKVSHEKSRCITVSNPNGLYVTDDGIVTHNSTCVVDLNLYVATLFALMWAPYRYYGYAPSTQFTIVFGGYSQKKASELLLEPMMNVLRSSDYFQQCRTWTDMVKKQKEFEELGEVPNIYWTTSSPTSAIAFSNGLNVKVVSSEMDIVGQNILFGNCTEISFWQEQGGWSDEKIKKFFNRLRDRIDSRMKRDRISGFILDSSPNTMDSAIDQWIWEEAPQDKSCYILSGPRWKFFKNEFNPDCFDSKGNVKVGDWEHNFPMAKGGNGKTAHPIDSPLELEQYDPIDVVWCPRDGETGSMYDKGKLGPSEFLRDWCGIPAGQADRIFADTSVLNCVFDNKLRNFEGSIKADAMQDPEHLIWDQVKDVFFNKVLDKYYFYYNPDTPRVLSVDQSYAEDMTGITVSHYERMKDKIDTSTGDMLNCVVTDFTIVIVPSAGGQINLDAIRYFIKDLIEIGNLKIRHVGFDQFQSVPAQQYLRRRNITVDYVSVDKMNDPYKELIDFINKGRYFCGKNIYFLNNLKSIQWVKRKSGKLKVDHIKGDLVQDDSELSGINAKDVADAAASNVYLLSKFEEEMVGTSVWSPNIDDKHDYDSALKKTQNLMANMGFTL